MTEPEDRLLDTSCPRCGCHLVHEFRCNCGAKHGAIRGDWAKLRHWGFLIEKPEVRDDGSKRNGFYKITQRGIDFVHGRIHVRKFIYLYAGQLLNQPCEKTVSIDEALKD